MIRNFPVGSYHERTTEHTGICDLLTIRFQSSMAFGLHSLPPDLCSNFYKYLDVFSLYLFLATCRAYYEGIKSSLSSLEMSFSPASQRRFWPSFALDPKSPLKAFFLHLPGHSLSTAFPLEVQGSEFAKLPSELVLLSLTFNISCTDESISNLPPTLQRLEFPRNRTLSSACIPLLPRSLTWLNLRKAFKIKDTNLEHFPPKLTYLNIASAAVTPTGLAKLHQSVQYLNLEFVSISASCVASLPRYLTQFICPSAYNTLQGVTVTQLPRSLVEMDLQTCGKMAAEDLVHLPRSLTSFISLWNENIPSSYVRDLPRSLTNLQLGWSLLDDTCAKLLPSGLKSLGLDSKRITGKIFGSLPSTLESLFIGSDQVYDEDLEAIASPLQYLKLTSSSLSAECVIHLPSNLQALHTFNIHKRFYHNMDRQLIVRLPPNLRELDLTGNSFLDEHDAPFLPRHLLTLIAPQIVFSSNSSLKALPRTITTLRISGTPDLNGSALSALPPSLRHLFFTGPIIGEEDLSLLPCCLKQLDLNILLTEPGWGDKIPSSVEYLRVSNHTVFVRNCSGELIRLGKNVR